MTMLRRALSGVIKGLLLGGLLAALLIQGLGVTVYSGALVAYAMGALTGILAGLVAGRPIWARGAAVEAGLKSAFGALLGVIALLVTRRFLDVAVDLGPLGNAAFGELPALSLPLVGAVLSALFELDNTGDDAAGGSRAGSRGPRVSRTARAAEFAEDDELERVEGAPPARARSREERR
jgi:hypothetical protein